MKKEEHPVFAKDSCILPGKSGPAQKAQASASTAGPVSKVVELMNARTYGTKAEADKSYLEFCKTLQKLHNEKTFVPPVCLT